MRAGADSVEEIHLTIDRELTWDMALEFDQLMRLSYAVRSCAMGTSLAMQRTEPELAAIAAFAPS